MIGKIYLHAAPKNINVGNINKFIKIISFIFALKKLEIYPIIKYIAEQALTK